MKDLMKIGVFLIGISALVIAMLGVLVYVKVIRTEKYETPFWLTCQVSKDGPAMVIHAQKDLSNVEVMHNGMTVFKKKKIRAGSDEVFWVKDEATYKVKAVVDGEEVSKAVTCVFPSNPQ